MHMYCEFEDTNTLYNNKKVYTCKYCNIKLILEDPDNAKILCFAKRDELNKLINPEDAAINGLNLENLNSTAISRALDKNSKDEVNISTTNSMIEAIKANKEQNLCSQEQINERLKICDSCEYYQNNSCMLCGCVVVRDANYTNKLAHKDQACPIMKWKQITD